MLGYLDVRVLSGLQHEVASKHQNRRSPLGIRRGCSTVFSLHSRQGRERESFRARQGFASPSEVARVLAFGCGPRQPPLQPLTRSPLKDRQHSKLFSS